jgi:hypothetical protein
VSYPHEVLIVMAYSYFASGFIGELMGHGRKHQAATEEEIDDQAKDAS